MAKKPLYRTTEDGNLVNTKTEQVIQVEGFSITKGRRGEMVQIEKKGGGTKSVIRWMVDETAFSFGPHGEAPVVKEKTTAIAKRSSAQVHSAPPPSVDGRTVLLSRDEALQLLKVTRAASELLFTKLLDETLAR